jgi:hypothetical protein
VFANRASNVSFGVLLLRAGILTFVLGSSFVTHAGESAVAAYHKLASEDIEAKRANLSVEKLADFTRIDVSARVRSASFGHKTTLLVAPDGHEFYVEYGRSTNRPARLFGPFPLKD